MSKVLEKVPELVTGNQRGVSPSTNDLRNADRSVDLEMLAL